MSDVNLPALADADRSNALKTPLQQMDQAYKACKFGLFHVKLLTISCVGFVAGISVSATTAYLLPSAECDLNMTLVQKGLLNAIPYLGMLFSTVIAGFLTDTFGRKIFIMLGFGGMFLFNFIAGSSQTYAVLITAKTLEGILFATSFSAVVTLTSEFCYKEVRDRVMLCQSSFAALAPIIIAGVAWSTLTQDWKATFFDGKLVLNTWNFYLFIMSLWSLLAFILYTVCLPESPKYLVSQKKYDEARAILVQIYKTNTRKPAETYPYINIWKDKSKLQLPELEEEKAQSIRHQIVVGLHNIKPMFRRPLNIHLLLIGLSNFLIMDIYNILRLWFPQLSTIAEHYKLNGDQNLCDMLDSYTSNLKATSHNTTSTVCVPNLSGDETYINSMIIGCACIPPYFITGVLVNKVGKKNLLIAAGLICTAATLGLRWANSKTTMVALFSIDIAITQVMMSLNQAFIVQYLPTTTRSLGISLIMMTGRIGTLVGNVAFPILLDMGCVIPFFTMTAMMICVTSTALFLPSDK